MDKQLRALAHALAPRAALAAALAAGPAAFRTPAQDDVAAPLARVQARLYADQCALFDLAVGVASCLLPV
ncbi:hypothetical protein OFN60_42955, partial [Escherichia coli]|nr:hypothetical protein [Escherichia coli]